MAKKPTVGWIGLGKMGVPMAHNALKAGYPLTVYNRSRAKTETLAEAGAAVADSPAALVRAAQIIISMISDDAALAAITEGETGLLQAAKAGSCYIDMSTVSPAASARVAGLAAERGIGYLRAPVSGGVVLAAAGTLTILVSGTAADLERARPLLETMGKKLYHVGEAEQARYVKLALNMMVGVTAAMMGEALAFAERSGMDWDGMLEVIGNSAIASPLVGYKLQPLQQRDFTPTFSAAQMAKDFDLVLEAARETSTPMPLTAMVRQGWSAMIASGRGEDDFFGYVQVMEELSGLTPRR